MPVKGFKFDIEPTWGFDLNDRDCKSHGYPVISLPPPGIWLKRNSFPFSILYVRPKYQARILVYEKKNEYVSVGKICIPNVFPMSAITEFFCNYMY